MIYCPQCGTPNKPNSKFCKNCAALLAPSTDIQCPICGTANPQEATACSNCGSRLTTTFSASSEKTTPADTPENITPFTPPELAQDAEALSNEPPSGEPSSSRPSFARPSSEWLKRLNKTAPSQSTPTPQPATPDTSSTAVPEWLREIQAEANKQAAASRDVETESEKAAPPIAAQAASEPPAPSKPQLSEIKLTGDDYDYSDIGGQVTDEMKATLEANAASVQSVDDEIALARKLLGLDVEAVAETPPPLAASQAEAPAQAVAPIETPPPAPSKPPLSEIKLTGDDYDYSDIGGQITDEMKATLEANAASVQSVDDEIALARKLLGLEVEETIPAPTPTVSPRAQVPTDTVTPAISEIPAPPETHAESETAPSEISQPVAELESTAPEISEITASEPLAVESIAPIETPPPAPSKPQLSEIKLTGDDYDYSDIGGQVTDEMKATLEANAPSVQSVDDEIALARKLLGLDVEAVAETPPPLAASQAEAPAQAVVSEPAPPPASDIVAEAPAEAVSAPLAAEPQTAEHAPTPTAEIEPSAPTVSGLEIEPPLAAELPAEPPHAELPPIAETIEPPSKPPLESGELPEWLREILPSAATEPAVSSEPEISGDETEMPPWLREMAPADLDLETGVPAPSRSLLSSLPELDEHERGDLPDWLREPPAPVQTRQAQAEPSGDESREAETTAPLELPDWFSGAVPLGATPRDPFEVIETTGPLAGVSGILPLAVAITEPHTLTTPTPVRSDGGRIFQTLLAEPLTPTARTEPQAERRALFTANHLFYLAILLAALIPLFFGLEQAGLGLDASKSASALFYDQLVSVPPNETVLLAFDYTPGQAVELDPAARAILNDLVARQVNVVAVSSNPFGATMAQTLLSRAQETQPKFQFVNLGYVFGNESGLKKLALGWVPANYVDANGTRWDASPLARTVRGMDDFALVILVAGEDASLRAWMEQVQPNIHAPIVGATTALVEPQARNYVNAKQLQASLRGLTGAAELELLSNQTGQAVKTVDALSLVSLVLAAIIIAANVMGLLKRGSGSK